MSTYFLPNIVKHCDCNSPEGFDSIQSKSIDLIIGDFPYECTQNAWDKKKTFALDVTLSNCFRVLTKNGVLILFSKQPFTSKLVIQLEPYFKQEIIWVKEKPTNCFNANKLPLSIHENILVFSKGVPVYHPQKK